MSNSFKLCSAHFSSGDKEHFGGLRPPVTPSNCPVEMAPMAKLKGAPFAIIYVLHIGTFFTKVKPSRE